jgi:hypothetical protein
MPTALPIPRKLLAALAAVAVVGCQPNTPRPVPSVPQIGADLKCAQGDHGYEDAQAGWGFCYPIGWKYIERSQASQSPPGLDLTFDVTFAPETPQPCISSSPAPSSSPGSSPLPRPASSPCTGQFAFMIISTYERGDSRSLGDWVGTHLKEGLTLEAISWGNAVEAARLSDGRRVALTPHHVVILDMHTGLLDLETQMSERLATWKFSF